MCIWAAYAGPRPAAEVVHKMIWRSYGIWGGYYSGLVSNDNGNGHFCGTKTAKALSLFKKNKVCFCSVWTPCKELRVNNFGASRLLMRSSRLVSKAYCLSLSWYFLFQNRHSGYW